jgi:hypothetical protein
MGGSLSGSDELDWYERPLQRLSDAGERASRAKLANHGRPYRCHTSRAKLAHHDRPYRCHTSLPTTVTTPIVTKTSGR